MFKYPKIKRLGHPDTEGILGPGTLTIQEKLDGANFRFHHQTHLDDEYQDDGRDLVFGSRNVLYKNEKDVDSAFYHAVEFVREDIADYGIQYLADAPIVVFGEAMHPHTLEYDWDDTPNVLVFDAYNTETGRFVDSHELNELCNVLDLPTAPVFYEYTDPSEFNAEEFDIPDSNYRDGIAEGVVLKNHHQGTYAKLRSEESHEKHGSAESKNFEPEDDTGELAATYVTEARIEKHAHKLVDEGEYDGVQMEMMQDLPLRVLNDVFEEEHEEIVLENWEIDFGDLRSKASKRCARRLKEMMVRGVA